MQSLLPQWFTEMLPPPFFPLKLSWLSRILGLDLWTQIHYLPRLPALLIKAPFFSLKTNKQKYLGVNERNPGPPSPLLLGLFPVYLSLPLQSLGDAPFLGPQVWTSESEDQGERLVSHPRPTWKAFCCLRTQLSLRCWTMEAPPFGENLHPITLK